MTDMQYVRKDNKVFPVVEGKLGEPQVFPSISKAKHFCRGHAMGVVRRWESLEREHGKNFMKELSK